MKTLLRFKWPFALLLIGIALMATAIISVVSAVQDTGTQFLGPGDTTVTITKPGDYTLWRETKASVNGQIMTFPDNLPAGTTIKVLKEPEGTIIPLRSDSSSSVQSGDTQRVSVGELTFTNPGQYQVAVTGLTEQRAFYLDEAKFLRVFTTFMTCIAAGFAFLFAAFASGIIVLIKVLNRTA